MNDNPRRLIRHAFFRRYVRVEVPCLHDDGNGILFMEPTTVGSLWLENDLHENELEFESYMGRSKKNVRVTSDGIHAEIHEI